eukprot:2850548-Prymnesium_polylepis.1
MQFVGKAIGLGGDGPADEAHAMMVTLNMQDILCEWKGLQGNGERLKKWFGGEGAPPNPPHLCTPPPARAPHWNRARVKASARAAVLEAELSASASGYLVGAGPTYADFFCYPSLVSRFDWLDESPDGFPKKTDFPKLDAYVANMKALLAGARVTLVEKGYPMDP